MHVDRAEAIGALVGDILTTEFANGATIETTIVGLFDEGVIVTQDYLYDYGALATAGVSQTAEWLAVSIADGAPPAAIDALVTSLSDEFPAANVETSDEFRERIVGMIDQILTMMHIMVALAVIIADSRSSCRRSGPFDRSRVRGRGG